MNLKYYNIYVNSEHLLVSMLSSTRELLVCMSLLTENFRHNIIILHIYKNLECWV